MARMVQCIKLGKEAEGLDFPPYPGELGKRIWENVSKEAWAAWLKQQTMLVNENRLNLADAARPPVPGAPDGKALLRRRRRRRAGLRSPDQLSACARAMAEPVAWRADGVPRSARFDDIYHSESGAAGAGAACVPGRLRPARGLGRPGAMADSRNRLRAGPQFPDSLAGLAGRPAAAAAAALRLDRGAGRSRATTCCAPRRPIPNSRRWPPSSARSGRACCRAFIAWPSTTAACCSRCASATCSPCCAPAALRGRQHLPRRLQPRAQSRRCGRPRRSRRVARFARRGTRLATWTIARAVRDALAQCGFQVRKAPGPAAQARLPAAACSSRPGEPRRHAHLRPRPRARRALRGDRRRAGRRRRRGQPGAARLAGHGARRRRSPRRRRLGPAGRRARAACVARRRPAVAPDARRHPRHLAAARTTAGRRQRLARQRRARAPRRGDDTPAGRLVGRGAQRVLARLAGAAARGRPA